MLSYKLTPLKPIVKRFGCAHSIDELLIYAIILKETSGNTWKTRFEPVYFEKNKTHLHGTYAKKLVISSETERVHQCMSWGLMQIMGVVAREMGYDDDLTKLLIPEVGIEWGVKKLDKLLVLHRNTDLAVSAYNHGSPVENDPYVRDVNTLVSRLHGENIL